MTKIILIGGASMAPVLASLQAQGHNVSIASEREEPAEDHSVAGMLEGLRAARDERTAADYSMADVDATFDRIFGPGASLVPLTDMFLSDDDLLYGTESVGPEFPGLHTLFGMTDDDLIEAEAEEAEQLAFAKAYDSLMRMLDVFAFVSGNPVTTEQRITMTLLLSNDDTAEAFATAAEDLIASGLFE